MFFFLGRDGICDGQCPILLLRLVEKQDGGPLKMDPQTITKGHMVALAGGPSTFWFVSLLVESVMSVMPVLFVCIYLLQRLRKLVFNDITVETRRPRFTLAGGVIVFGMNHSWQSMWVYTCGRVCALLCCGAAVTDFWRHTVFFLRTRMRSKP